MFGLIEIAICIRLKQSTHDREVSCFSALVNARKVFDVNCWATQMRMDLHGSTERNQNCNLPERRVLIKKNQGNAFELVVTRQLDERFSDVCVERTTEKTKNSNLSISIDRNERLCCLSTWCRQKHASSWFRNGKIQLRPSDKSARENGRRDDNCHVKIIINHIWQMSGWMQRAIGLISLASTASISGDTMQQVNYSISAFRIRVRLMWPNHNHLSFRLCVHWRLTKCR